MERLFFSLPEHNEATCRTCRRGGSHSHAPSHQTNEASAPRRKDIRDSEEGQKRMLNAATTVLENVHKGKRVEEDALPPQAVMARLLRELEDDFMHYKS